jgi:dCMP deaminase
MQLLPERPSWQATYMSMCYLMAYRSPDRSTKVGAVITTEDNVPIALGYNGLPRGIEDRDEFHVKPEKYFYFEHAERNAIYNAARIGARMDMAHTLYITWIPCADCARAIVQTGVKKVVVHKYGQEAYYHSKGSAGNWGDSQTATDTILQDIEVEWFEGAIIGELHGYYSSKYYRFPDGGFEFVGE